MTKIPKKAQQVFNQFIFDEMMNKMREVELLEKAHKRLIEFMTKQWKICFAVSEEDFKRGKKLPRDFNISDKLRKAYEKILKEGSV